MKSHIDRQTGAVFELGPHSLRAVGPEARSALAMVSLILEYCCNK